MHNRRSIESSRLAAVPAIVIWFALAIAAAAFSQELLAALCFFFGMLGMVSQLWAKRSMEKVELSIDCTCTGLYPGMKTQLLYAVRNCKALPLAWLELSQNAHEKECLVPGDEYERYEAFRQEGGTMPAYRLRFSFLRGWQEMELAAEWTAVRRGIYRPAEYLVRSGDGFGLVQIERTLPPEQLWEVAVYPAHVPVDVRPLLRYRWENAAGVSGYTEDPSLISGLRPYMQGDSWKRINWRMAARQQEELQINLLQKVRPSAFLFLLDGESFASGANGEKALESALSLLGSVISDLFENGVTCGLCLPKAADGQAFVLPPAPERSASELLHRLAGYDPRREPRRSPSGTIEGILPSCFMTSEVHAALEVSSAVFVVTAAPDGFPAGLIRASESGKTTFLTCEGAASADPEVRCLPLDTLRRCSYG